MDRFEPTERTTLKRLPRRGVFDRETVYRILDDAFICHVGFAVEGRPFVIPTGFGRKGDTLYIHGSAASRMLRALSGGIEVCMTVTHLDGLVLARSAFHHSVNYRSVMIFGAASLIEDEEEKLEALRVLSEQIIPGRWDEVRLPNATELKQTKVLKLDLEEVSAKVRTGPPIDDEEDYALRVWAGEVPLRLTAFEPVADPRLPDGVEVSRSASRYSKNNGRNSRK